MGYEPGSGECSSPKSGKADFSEKSDRHFSLEIKGFLDEDVLAPENFHSCLETATSSLNQEIVDFRANLFLYFKVNFLS